MMPMGGESRVSYDPACGIVASEDSAQACLCIYGNALLLYKQHGCCMLTVADGKVQGSVFLRHCMIDVGASAHEQLRGVCMVPFNRQDQGCSAPLR